MMIRKNVLVLLIALFIPVATIAGGWPQKKGKGYFKIGQMISISSRYFNPEGNKITIEPRIGLYVTSFYGEYGLTDKLTVVGYVPFVTRSVLNNLQLRNGEFKEGDALTSFGDTEIGLKYGLVKDKPIVMSATLSVGLPLGNPGSPETSGLQTGDGEFNQKLSLDVSKSFYPKPIYASVSAGFNNRTKGFSEEVHFGAEVGYSVGRFTIITKLNGVESLRNGDTRDNEQQSVFGNNIEFLTFTPELIYEFSSGKSGLSANIVTVISGSQVLASPAYNAGFFLKI